MENIGLILLGVDGSLAEDTEKWVRLPDITTEGITSQVLIHIFKHVLTTSVLEFFLNTESLQLYQKLVKA